LFTSGVCPGGEAIVADPAPAVKFARNPLILLAFFASGAGRGFGASIHFTIYFFGGVYTGYVTQWIG
jgi:hypothetical protein